MGELIFWAIYLLSVFVVARVILNAMCRAVDRGRRLRIGPFVYRPARRRGVQRFYEQARRDRVRLQHDTWGKVQPECQCGGCVKERDYVESRNKWTAAIMRGNAPSATLHQPHVCTVDKACAHAVFADPATLPIRDSVFSQPPVRTAPGRVAFTPLFSPPAQGLAFGPCGGCRTDTLLAADDSPTGWRCQSCTDLELVKAANQARWGR